MEGLPCHSLTMITLILTEPNVPSPSIWPTILPYGNLASHNSHSLLRPPPLYSFLLVVSRVGREGREGREGDYTIL